MTETMSWSPTAAMDAAFSIRRGDLISGDGVAERLPLHRWTCDPDVADRRLFLDHCSGVTLDVGCGPGRLASALAARAVHVVGIDVSAEAVRQARARGAVALHRDVFTHLPGAGAWDHALLADGNVGIGGDPVRLLRRVGELVRPGGTVLTELAATGGGVVFDRLRLRVGERVSAPFPWAFVGVDAIGAVARRAGLAVRGIRHLRGRRVAILGRAGPG